MKEMLPHRHPEEIKIFLGLVGYNRKCIQCFTDLVRFLTALTRKEVTFDFTSIVSGSICYVEEKSYG